MKKLMNKKGFTLMEMLIVVAIIVILVAVAMPTFTSSLEEAKTNTDKANLRAAKAVANTVDMTKSWDQFGVDEESKEEIILYFDIESGSFTTNAVAAYGQANGYTSKVIKVEVLEGEMVDNSLDWTESTKEDE